MANLYPGGHKGDYTLNLREDPAYMSTGSFPCPVCGGSFRALKLRDVKLIPLRTGELRTQFKDVEPLYYEITTCPNCRYSAQTAMFDKLLTSRRKMILEKLTPYLPELMPWSESPASAGAVFERYYLALLCAGAGFADRELVEAGLWCKLSGVYADAGDAGMEAYAAGEAQKAYLTAFQNLRIQPVKFPSLNLRIGLLSVKIGDVKTARDFLYKVKLDPNSTRVQKDGADDAINELKETVTDHA
ncbi:MAG: DUF2225 domain-containing protein [Oscillospiraceae bacterium]|jgi:hypothetical protein|nr:DUF2225 domain-containing protein [Oscillospiraceae bacterium]